MYKRQPIVCSHSSSRALCDVPRNLTDDQMRALAAKGEMCIRDSSMVRELLDTQDSKTFDKLYERIEKYEGISDTL